jgi:hypothetical protein
MTRSGRCSPQVLNIGNQHKIPENMFKQNIKFFYLFLITVMAVLFFQEVMRFSIWNRPFLYKVDASNLVTIQSLGKDGKVGGLLDDSDLTCSFPLRDQTGKWSDRDNVIALCVNNIKQR